MVYKLLRVNLFSKFRDLLKWVAKEPTNKAEVRAKSMVKIVCANAEISREFDNQYESHDCYSALSYVLCLHLCCKSEKEIRPQGG